MLPINSIFFSNKWFIKVTYFKLRSKQHFKNEAKTVLAGDMCLKK